MSTAIGTKWIEELVWEEWCEIAMVVGSLVLGATMGIAILNKEFFYPFWQKKLEQNNFNTFIKYRY